MTLQQPSLAAAEGAVQVRTWSEVDTVWARVRPLSGREQFEIGQARGTVTHEITCRFPVHNSSGSAVRITPAMRFLHETTRELYVQSVTEVQERGRYYRCLCAEQVS